MSKARHANGQSSAPIGLAIGAVSLTAGIVMLVPALVELFRYSPYEDPGAGKAGLFLGLGFVFCAGIPLLWLAVRGAGAAGRSYLAWRRSLTPGERALLIWAELAGLAGAHVAWRDYNQRESARLTESVMGSVPELPGENG
jgi:hypothetical protein